MMPNDYDERVSLNRQISLQRDPELGHRLLTGPYPYARNEQEAWRQAATEAVQRHDQRLSDAEQVQLFAALLYAATECHTG